MDLTCLMNRISIFLSTLKNRTILLVGPIPPPLGGIPKYVSDLYNSSYLKERFDVQLFNTAIPQNVRRFEKRNERSYFSFLSDGVMPGFRLLFYVFTTFFSFARFLLIKKPGVVQVFTSSFWGFWRSCMYIFIAKLFRAKVIFHLLNAVDVFWGESSRLSRLLIKFVLNKSDVLLVQSDGIKNFVEGISATPVVAIYNGVDIWKYDKSPSRKYFSNGKVQVLFLGGLSKNKGVFDIIQAAGRINNNNIYYVFVGAGDIRKFEEYARNNGVDKQVRFTGKISDKEKDAILIRSDIFLLPSYAEGQPLSILEAMSAGLPIISSTVGSIPEVVIDGVNGFLLEPGDINKLAEKISILVEDPILRKKISEHNYSQARKLYNINRVFHEMGEVYNWV